MKKHFKIFFAFLILIAIYSCSDNNSELVSPKGDGISILSKIISPSYNWTTYTYWDPLYQQYFTQCTPAYSFTFMNYNYNLNYSRVNHYNGTYTNTVIVNVNNTYCTTVVWNNSDSSGDESGLLPTKWFSYNGTGMGIQLNVLEFYIPMNSYSEPRQVKIVIMDGR